MLAALLGGVLGVNGRADALLRARAARLDRGLEVLRARLAALEEGGGGAERERGDAPAAPPGPGEPRHHRLSGKA
jgi:hypothetical protein